MSTAEQERTSDCEACEHVLQAISAFARLHAIKLYRLTVTLPDSVPVLPCLDHEVMLHEGISPHAAMYIEETDNGGLHEVVCVPAKQSLEIDVVSTSGEHTNESHVRLVNLLRECLPNYTVRVNGPLWFRGDRRVARACRAQISLRDVLVSADFESLNRALNRLKTIGALMEKQSRVASWTVRTVTGPLLAVTGFVSYQILGSFTESLGDVWVQGLRYSIVGGLGAVFLYLGLKAVHLTEMANRVWKRSSEYGLILSERQRIADGSSSSIAPGPNVGLHSRSQQ